MTDARDKVLARLRSNPVDPMPMPALPMRRFDWDRTERLARFRQMLEAVRGEIHQVGDDWPSRLAAVLRRAGAANLAYGPNGPLGAELETGWPKDAGAPRLLPQVHDIEQGRDRLFDGTDAGLTSCHAAVAETGSLVLRPSPAEPRLLSLVPPIHCVLLEADRIVSTLHELMVEQDWAGAGMPTNLLLISGPSKSADIEQTLAYGVHGPGSLIVLVRDVSNGAAPRVV